MLKSSFIKTYVILEKSKKPYITLLYDFYNIKVWKVDGKYVRENMDMDFTHGGNNGAYPWIPRNEIWIDDGVNENEVNAIALHEMVERKEMLLGGLDYNRAHDIAIQVERTFRLRPAGIFAEMKEISSTDNGFAKAIPIKGYVRTRHGKLERVKPSLRDASLHPEMPVGRDMTPSILMAIGPTGKKYYVEDVRLYPTSRRPLTFGELVELQKTSPSTRVTVKMEDQERQIEVRWLALPELEHAPTVKVKTGEYPPVVLPKGTPNPGEYVMLDGTWAKVITSSTAVSTRLAVRKIYDEINECPPNVDPNAEYHLTFEHAAQAKRLKEQWNERYIKFFKNCPVVTAHDELERNVTQVENVALRHKHDVERAYVFSNDGNLKLSQDGNSRHVNFNDSEILKLPGTIMTHNHPVTGAFSIDDVFKAHQWGLSEIRAVTESFVYVLKPPVGKLAFDMEMAQREGEQPGTSDIEQAFDGITQSVLKGFRKDLALGKINLSDMNEVGWDEVLKNLAKTTGLRYERMRWPDAEIRREGGYHYEHKHIR